MRHGGPEADRRNARVVERVVKHTHDPGRPFVARTLEAETLDEFLIGRTAGHR
jgi:hypothetical protein